MELKERFINLLESKKVTPYLVSNETGVSQSTLSRIVNGTTAKISIKTAKLLANYFKVDQYWLLTGKPPMLRDQTVQSLSPTPQWSTSQVTELQDKDNQLIERSKKNAKKRLIPFYDINATAGTMQMSNMDAVSQPDDWIDAGDWFRDADTAMRVHGDSMSPVYKSGSIVVMREVQDKNLIIYGQDYVLETSEYRVIKRLQKSAEKGHWFACSVNEEVWEKGDLAGRLIHEPFDIDINNVYRVFRVLGCVNRTESSHIIHANKN